MTTQNIAYVITNVSNAPWPRLGHFTNRLTEIYLTYNI